MNRRIQAAFTWTKLLNAPFWALYCMLPFIIYRDLHGSSTLVALAVAIKPLSSLLAPYWGAQVKHHPAWLRNNIIWAGILGHLPFLFSPFFSSPWFFLLSSALYMALWRGAIPAWMELVKMHVSKGQHSPLFARSSALTYLGDAIFACAFGWLLDQYVEAWRWLFPLTALLACLSLCWQFLLPTLSSPAPDLKEPEMWSQQLLAPWKQAWQLLKQRYDFMCFQIGFTLGGGGLMIIHGALPTFFTDVLHISYSEMGLALGVCKGIGFLAATPIWSKYFNRLDIYRFNGWVTAAAMVYPLFLLCASWHMMWLYAAYLFYGIMQGGSEIGWNLSGVAFSREEESTRFTRVNVLMVGLRSGLAPLGGLICAQVSPYAAILLGALFSLLATQSLFFFSRSFKYNPIRGDAL